MSFQLHLYLVMWCYTKLPEATQAALSSKCGPGQTQDRRRGSNLLQLVPNFPLMSPTQLLSTPDKDPVFPAQSKDHHSIRILPEFCCSTKLMEQPGALGQDNGHIRTSTSQMRSHYHWTKWWWRKDGKSLIDLSIFTSASLLKIRYVQNLQCRWLRWIQKTRKEGGQRRRRIALPLYVSHRKVI